MMKAMLIYNPAAGQRQVEAELHNAIRYLEGRGWQIIWRQTLGSGDATGYAREAVDIGCDVAIAAGGDGTIGQVVNGLAHSETALGVLPIGTTNVWAREIGIPQNSPLRPRGLQDAVKILTEGQSRCVDLGVVNGRYFLMWAGVGFDAQLVGQVEERPMVKRRLGKLAFIVALITETIRLTGTRSTIWLDGNKLNERLLLLVASNIQLYAGIVRLAPTATLNDGLLDICIFQGISGLSSCRHIFTALLGLHVRDPDVVYHQARHIVVETSRPLPAQADGDVFGTTPVEIKIAPSALNVIVPRHLPAKVLRVVGSQPGEVEPAQPLTLAGLLERLKR